MSVFAVRGTGFGKSFKNARSNVEVYGYIPRSVQIKNMLTSGKRLDAYRAGMYMYNAGSFDNFTADPALLSAMSPVYNDKLSSLERQAFLAGLSRSYHDFVDSCSDPDKLGKAKKFKSRIFGEFTPAPVVESGSSEVTE